MPHPLIDEAFKVAHDFKDGGAAGLSKKLEHPSLVNEVRETGTAKLGLVMAFKMTQKTGDLRILNEFANGCGQMLVPLPESLEGESDDCMTRLSEASREFAELCREVCSDLADDLVSDNELVRINRHAGDLIVAINALQTAVAKRNAASKPAIRAVWR